MFLDEAWTKTNMTRLRGRSRVAANASSAVRHAGAGRPARVSSATIGSSHRWCSTARLAVAPSRARIEQFLAPGLQPGDIVVADKLASHNHRFARGHRGARHPHDGPAVPLARSQPDRAGVRQTQIASPQRHSARHCRPALARPLTAGRVPQLSGQRGLRTASVKYQPRNFGESTREARRFAI